MFKAKISLLVKFKVQIKSAVASFWGRILICLLAETQYTRYYVKNVNKIDGFDVPYFIGLVCVFATLFVVMCFFISKEAVDEAMCYTGTDGFPWIRVALRSFLPGESVYFLFTVVPWGDMIFWAFDFLPYNFARFGNHTSVFLEYLYNCIYVAPSGRHTAIFAERFYSWRDLAAFIPVFVIYEFVCVALFLVVFGTVYRYKHSYSRKKSMDIFI